MVDSGLARINRVDPSLGLNRLEICRISRASADQRGGRAGRTAPGVCLRLWTEATQRRLPNTSCRKSPASICRRAMLQLLCWGEPDPAGFPWFEPPPREMIDRALALLQQLGATDGSGLTELGRRMGRLPVEPRIARLLCEGQALGHARRIALVGALLSERDPFYGSGDSGPRSAARHWSNSDVLDRVAAVEEFTKIEATRSESRLARCRRRAVHLLRARDQLLRECYRRHERIWRRADKRRRRLRPTKPCGGRSWLHSPIAWLGGAMRPGSGPSWSADAACGCMNRVRCAKRSCLSASICKKSAKLNRWCGRLRPSNANGCRPNRSPRPSTSNSTPSASGSSLFAARDISI